LLLYPAKGPTKKNVVEYKNSLIYKNLGEKGTSIFYKIFANNNIALRDLFFKDNKLIQHFWNKVMEIVTINDLLVSKKKGV